MAEKMYSPPEREGKKWLMRVRRASPPNFQVWRPASRLMVSARWRRSSVVWRGRMVERPKPSITLEMRVRTSAELLVEDCKSRETCARRWLVRRDVNALLKGRTGVWVRTDSAAFSE